MTHGGDSVILGITPPPLDYAPLGGPTARGGGRGILEITLPPSWAIGPMGWDVSYLQSFGLT